MKQHPTATRRRRLTVTIATWLTCLALLAIGTPALAGPYDAPAGYYNNATGTGATLKSQLATIMSTGHIQRSYGDFRSSAAITDRDPNNANNILLGYTRASVPATWNSGVTWNREHVWPQSLQPGSASNSSRGNLGDPHALRPLNPSVNSSRGNKPFGLDNTTGSNRAVSGGYYYPGDADAGDTARQLFYSSTRYFGLSLVEGFPGSNQMSDLSSLINWHFIDTPDDFELRRNHTIYSQAENPSFYTNNRNAYIDRPEFVWSVYVDQQNDSSITLDGASPSGGATSKTVDFGSVLVGAPMPSTQSVGVTKNGLDGTYYEVTTSGAATSSIEGRYNAFRNGTIDSTSINAGLSGSTGTAGALSGTITIDNLDVTTSGGAGRGANDGDDTITLSLDVLDHAAPSFDAITQVSTLNLDFGTVEAGSANPTLGFDLSNLIGTAGFTASLDLDAIAGSGDTSVLTTDLSTFTGASALAAGASSSFSAQLDTAGVGSFSATYLLSFSDEDLPGAASLGDLTLNLIADVVISGDADFDQDSDVDFADFITLQRNYGSEDGDPEDGDANGDGDINDDDMFIWTNQFGLGNGPLSAVTAVPEPASLAMLASLLIGLTAGRQRS